MSRWTVAGLTVVGASWLAAVFAATYSLVAYLWDRFAGR